MKTDFIPIDYDYFDFQGRNYTKIIGRNSKGKRICVIDSCPVYFWSILKEGLKQGKIEKLIEKIKKIKLDIKGRQTKVEKVELHDKNFLGKKVRALKIFATNYKDLHDIADKLGMSEIEKRRGYDLGFITHYIIEKKLNPLQWYEIEGEIIDNTTEFNGIAQELDVDFCIKVENIKKLEKEDFKLKILTFDIEADEFKIGEGEILMISLVSENFRKVITWKTSPKFIKHDYIEFVKNEAELLEKFVEYVKKISPDFLVGYFSDGFDLPYLKARAEKNKIKLSLGLDESQPRFFRGAISTGKIFGIVHIDLLKFIQTAYSQYMQSETLSLNEVAKEFLGEKKKDFEFKHSSKLNGKDWENYFEYNLYDSILVYNLFQKFWQDLLEFTRIMQEPVFDVSRNGMSNNVEDYILHNLDKFNEIPEKRPTYDEISKRRKRLPYKGAFVLQPQAGLYENLAVFDFTSSYGSIIVTYNLSKSTLLEKPEKDSYSIDIDKRKVFFSKEPGFFPQMLKEIIKKRRQYKKELKQKPDSVKRARSNAFKLLANASYGYLGFFGARYYCEEAAAATAAFARKAIKEAIEKTNKAGFSVIYADSVGENTKIIIKENGKIYEKEIKGLFKEINKKSEEGKEYYFPRKIEVLTLEKGKAVFKPVKYVMRHKCKKKMYRIHFTNAWSIDVTEDHSLIGYQSQNFNQTKQNKINPLNRLIEIKPKEIRKKANMIIALKKIPEGTTKERKNYPKEVYEFMGYFIGDGSFNSNFNKKNYYLNLATGKDSKEVIEKLLNPLKEKGYIKNFWEYKKGDIKINGLKLVNIINKNFRDKKKKIIPQWLFGEKEENIASFLRGLFSADGSVMTKKRKKEIMIKYSSINDDYIQIVRKLLYRVGIANSVFKENKKNRYNQYTNNSYSKIIWIKDKKNFMEKIGFLLERKNKAVKIKDSLRTKSIAQFEFDLQNVKKIEKIETPEYVYDLEVEGTHTFFANYVLAHNTDGFAFTLNKKTKSQTLDFLKKLNSQLPGIMELELEDFYKRGIWVTKRTGEFGAKKKYALINEKGKLKIRGFETVRRDWCNLAREIQNKVIRQILKDGNEKKALEYVKKIIKQIKKREIDKRQMIIRTQLKKPLSEYKAISPHVIAAKKMREREMPIDPGSLIEYYIAEAKSGKKAKLIRERVKLPDEKGEYDVEYYLKHQILPAVENIFQVFNIDVKEIMERKKQTKLGDFKKH